jgi:hypothetical protein
MKLSLFRNFVSVLLLTYDFRAWYEVEGFLRAKDILEVFKARLKHLG